MSRSSLDKDNKYDDPQTSPPSMTASPRTGSIEHIEAVQLRKWPSDWRAYRALLGGFLLMFNSWGLVNTFGTFQSYYKIHLLPDTSTVLITLIGATQSFMVLIFSFGVGRLLDAGYHRHLAAAGAFITSFSMFMLSLCGGDGTYGSGNYVYIWLTQGLFMGLGMSCVFVYSSQVVASWFALRRSFAIGISASGASIAGLVYPLLFKNLVPDYGFATSVRLVAVVVSATSLLSFFVAIPEPTREPRVPKKWLEPSIWWDLGAFRMTSYSWFVAAISFMFLGFYAVFFNLEDWADWRGIGVAEDVTGNQGVISGRGLEVYYLLAIMNATSTFGRLSSAYLSDKFRALNVHACSALLAAICVLCWWTVTKTLGVAIAFVIVYGMVSGALIALPPACVASLLSEAQQDSLGQRTGMMYTIAAPFALVGPVIGAQIEEQYGYLPLMGWCGACLMAAFVCMVMARLTADFSNTISDANMRSEEKVDEKA